MTDLRIETDFLHPEDELGFRLEIESRERLENIFLRMTVSNGPGNIVGMAGSGAFTIQKGTNQYRFTFPVTPLEAGGYLCDFTLCSFDGKVQTRHDYLRKVMGFQIESTQLYFGEKWTLRKWGSTRLSAIRVEEITKEEF